MFKIIIFIIIISQFVEKLNDKVSNTWILRTKTDVNQVSSLLVDNNFKLIQSVKLDNMENYIVEADYSKIYNENELNELEHRIKSNSMTILFEREKIKELNEIYLITIYKLKNKYYLMDNIILYIIKKLIIIFM